MATSSGSGGSGAPKKPVVVKESEKSAKLMGTNIKQRMLLRQRMQVLDRACDKVCNHITLGQRLTYKRFKQKLQRAKITYSKIMGDREMERDLRQKAQTFTYNTNFGQDPEDEEVLQRIWNSHGYNKKQTVSPRASDILGERSSPMRPQSTVTIANPSVIQRPETVTASAPRALPDIDQKRKGRFIATGLQDTQSSLGDEDDEFCHDDSDLEDQEGSAGTKPKSTRFSKDAVKLKKQRQVLKSAPSGNMGNSARSGNGTNRSGGNTGRSTGTNIFEEDTRPTLLDIQKERVKSAGYENRVRALCEDMKQFEVDKDKVIRDYYLVVLQTQAQAVQEASTYKRRFSQDSESDVRKALGNTSVRSMTMRRLNWDFQRKLQDDEIHVMPPPTNKMASVTAW